MHQNKDLPKSRQGKKRGKLSNRDMRYIHEHFRSMSPIEIAEQLNRSPAPVFKYLDKTVTGWRNECPFFSEKVEDEENRTFHQKIMQLSDSSGLTYSESKRTLRTEESLGAKTIGDIQELVQVIEEQKKFIDRLVSEVKDNTEYWFKSAVKAATAELAPQRRDLEIQRAKHISEVTQKHNMPSPPEPTHTSAETVKNNLGSFPGIYFAWHEGQVVYVGKANNIQKRLRSHGKVKGDMLVSFLKFHKNRLYRTECFYIWALAPKLNGEIIRDSHYVQDLHSQFTETIESRLEEPKRRGAND
tara:strand:+ start:208 stop:1107 length:900 start_codon:yes stop_codon:yes gene_type:complete